MDPIIVDSKETVSEVEVKPTRQAGIVGVVMGALFLVFGSAMFVLIGRDEGVEMPVLVLFGVFWGIVCLVIIVTSALHMRKGGLPMIRVESKDDPAAKHDPMERLRKLEGLRKDGLISEMEFAAKRREIMTRKW
jgi:polyferredoxin